MRYSEIYFMDDAPLIAPNDGVRQRLEQVSSPESGRDEAGFYHSRLLRADVQVWELGYKDLTRQAYDYLLTLAGKKESFVFRQENGKCRCRVSGVTGQWQQTLACQSGTLKLTIAQC